MHYRRRTLPRGKVEGGTGKFTVTEQFRFQLALFAGSEKISVIAVDVSYQSFGAFIGKVDGGSVCAHGREP